MKAKLQFNPCRNLLGCPVEPKMESKITSKIQKMHQFCVSMGLVPILQSSSNDDPLLLHFLVLIFNTFSSFNVFQGLGGPTHRNPFQGSTHLIFIFEDEVIMEMRISTVPGDKLTFSVIPVHQKIEMTMKINPVRVFEFRFDFNTVMIKTKLCLNLIQSCQHFESKLDSTSMAKKILILTS